MITGPVPVPRPSRAEHAETGGGDGRVAAQGRGIVGAMTLVLAMSGAASAAGAVTSPWSIAASANMTVPAAELVGVSCLSATSCVAVGDRAGPNGVNRALVERWEARGGRRGPARASRRRPS